MHGACAVPLRNTVQRAASGLARGVKCCAWVSPPALSLAHGVFSYRSWQALASSAASLSRFTLSLPQRVSLDSLRGLAHKNSRLGMLRVITFAQSLQHDFDTGVGPAAGDEPHMRASASAETDLRDPAHAIPTRNLPRLGPQQDLGVSSGVDQSGGVEVPGDGAAGVDGLEALKRAFSRQLPRCHCWFDVMQ